MRDMNRHVLLAAPRLEGSSNFNLNIGRNKAFETSEASKKAIQVAIGPKHGVSPLQHSANFTQF